MRQAQVPPVRAPPGQEAVPVLSQATGWGRGGEGGWGGVGAGTGGLGDFFRGKDACMARPHWPKGTPTRLRTSLM